MNRPAPGGSRTRWLGSNEWAGLDPPGLHDRIAVGPARELERLDRLEAIDLELLIEQRSAVRQLNQRLLAVGLTSVSLPTRTRDRAVATPAKPKAGSTTRFIRPNCGQILNVY